MKGRREGDGGRIWETRSGTVDGKRPSGKTDAVSVTGLFSNSSFSTPPPPSHNDEPEKQESFSHHHVAQLQPRPRARQGFLSYC